MNLSSKDFIYRGETLTGKNFDCSIIASVDCNEYHLRILYDHCDEPLRNKFLVDRIGEFYGYDFTPGYVDGNLCYIHANPI